MHPRCNSNAGLVLLRLGGGGTDAPVLGPIRTGAALPNQPARLTLSFRDRNAYDTHAATIDWGDGSGAQSARVRESRGRGEVSAAHTYAAQGSYQVVVRVSDSGGKASLARQLVAVPGQDAP
ncbi:PKD domain-containing protein [Massilia sp. DJPM01]|uniref:PKD domain-containing protein n=1 Tax=Massilia sp. DJPM01 TaxID=3024404 RepID=UPI00259E9EAE|nr:PKD domain-containing protein [Massilia sp. DJPM01]